MRPPGPGASGADCRQVQVPGFPQHPQCAEGQHPVRGQVKPHAPEPVALVEFQRHERGHGRADDGANKAFAPVGSNIASANNTCVSVLGRNCASNYDTNSPKDFILNPAAMTTIQMSGAAVQAIKSVTPRAYATVPDRAVGPQAGLTE